MSKLYRQPELKRYLDASALERRRVYAADRANGAKFDGPPRALRGPLPRGVPRLRRHVRLPAAQAGRREGRQRNRRTAALAQRGAGPGVRDGGRRGRRVAGRHAGPRPAEAREGRRCGRRRPSRSCRSPICSSLGKDAFLASHADQKAAAERAYLTSWALAYYLTFERHLIGTEAFRKYLVAVNSGGDPRKAFAELVGQELPAFEKDWHAYLSRLQSDGTVGEVESQGRSSRSMWTRFAGWTDSSAAASPSTGSLVSCRPTPDSRSGSTSCRLPSPRSFSW